MTVALRLLTIWSFIIWFCEISADSQALLDAQFRSVLDLRNNATEIPLGHYYDVTFETNSEKISQQWVDINYAEEYDPITQAELVLHAPINVTSHLFKVILTTAGGILFEDNNDDNLPSYIAPLMSYLPPNPKDTMKFVNSDSSFRVDWEKYLGPDEHNKLITTVKLNPDGSIQFFYHNLASNNKEVFRDLDTVSLSGLQDSFLSETNTLVYSQSKLSVETILSQASTMVTFRPQKVCEMLYESKCSGDCIFCEQGHCISQMNFMRKSTICSSKSIKSEELNFCEMNCPEMPLPVCASDGLTYGSKCHMLKESCLEPLSVTSEGVCPELEKNPEDYSHDCNSYESCPIKKDPVCASNNRTYPNFCLLMQINCNENLDLKVVNVGPCMESNCSKTCDKKISPVCGSDNKTYASECLLWVEKCRTNTDLRIESLGQCSQNKEVPINMESSDEVIQHASYSPALSSGKLFVCVLIGGIAGIVIGFGIYLFAKYKSPSIFNSGPHRLQWENIRSFFGSSSRRYNRFNLEDNDFLVLDVDDERAAKN